MTPSVTTTPVGPLIRPGATSQSVRRSEAPSWIRGGRAARPYRGVPDGGRPPLVDVAPGEPPRGQWFVYRSRLGVAPVFLEPRPLTLPLVA